MLATGGGPGTARDAMTEDDALAQFEARNMGWLTDEGVLLPCAIHGHLDLISTVPRFAEAYSRYDDICRDNADFVQQELDSLGPDEHPEMHRFDGMDDDARDELLKVVYLAGWIRLGKSFDSDAFWGDRPLKDKLALNRTPMIQAMRKPENWYVEAIGLTEHVRGHRRTLERIAGRLGCRLMMREMKYAVVNLGNKRRPDLRELLVPEAYEPG